ncbi:MAG: hypothetical protein EP343_33030 [Deltaproteobacteria bacterium]|nr:MAG: hypothetical protein EP343_33030 [Deltaproteobacteria bacterium]
MFVCICRGINEKKIQNSIDGGAVTAKQVYCALGVKPKCGKCRPEIQEMIDNVLRNRLGILPVFPQEQPLEQVA